MVMANINKMLWIEINKDVYVGGVCVLYVKKQEKQTTRTFF